MANNYGIPAEVEKEIRARDKVCIYCLKKMKKNHFKDKPTIEHLRVGCPVYWTSGTRGLKKTDLAICCQSCNSSRGPKKLSVWFKSLYCIKNNINKDTVTDPVKRHI